MRYIYSKLAKRIKQLEKNFLARRNILNSKNQDLIKAFILLSHAEFEEFIEEIALQKTLTLKTDWSNNRKVNYNSAAIFLTYDLSKNINKLSAGMEAFSFHEKKISSNNGIKEANLKNIFNPLGFNIENFDNYIVLNLNELGTTRGKIAHHSKYKIIQEYDLNTEKQKIYDTLSSLRGFREKILKNHSNYLY